MWKGTVSHPRARGRGHGFPEVQKENALGHGRPDHNVCAVSAWLRCLLREPLGTMARSRKASA